MLQRIRKIGNFNPKVKIGKRLSPSDVHVDRLETRFSLMYSNQADSFVHMRAFANVPVTERSNYYPLYTKADMFKSQLGVRGPGAVSAPVEFRVDTSNTYYCNVIAGHDTIDEQTQANTDAPFDPRRDTNVFLTDQALLYKEIDWASKFFTTGLWGTDATPSTKWDQSSSTPIQDMRTGLRTVQQNTGRRPNVAIFGQHAWDLVVDNADTVGRLDRGQTDGPAIVTKRAMAALLEVDEVLVMGSVQNTADLNQTATMAFIGDTDAVLLCYRTPRPSLRQPTAGLIFSWTGLLGANALGGRLTSWFEPSRKSDLMEIEVAYDMKLTGSDLGYFLHTTST